MHVQQCFMYLNTQAVSIGLSGKLAHSHAQRPRRDIQLRLA